MSSLLDALIPAPRLVEVDEVDLALPIARAWEVVRHGDLGGGSRIIRGLFALRDLPGRAKGERERAPLLAIDELVSTPERPGFQILLERPGHELAVGAIGKVWKPSIPFVHVANAQEFWRFSEEDFVKVAWSLRLTPLGETATRIAFEVRVDATDAAAWKRFSAYFTVIGPFSHLIRHILLEGLARQHGTPESKKEERTLPGDELLGEDIVDQVTHAVTIAASPADIWPWLVQMGCRRAGFYSWDLLDNGGKPSARVIHPELQKLEVGQILPATPEGKDGFEVLRIDGERALLLGGLYDEELGKQLPFASSRPSHYWHVTWSFVLEPLDGARTLLLVRARAASRPSRPLHVAGMRLVHHLMETAQLRHLAARAEGRLKRDDLHDALAGIGGAAIMLVAALTPPLRGWRKQWGLTARDVERPYPGDELVREPTWGWTHGVEIDASRERVWPWLAQIGASRGGFYSYQFLENLVGCDLTNAEVVRPEWELHEGDPLVLHPKMPSPKVVSVVPGHHFIAHAPADEQAQARGAPWGTMSWLFLLEPLGQTRCRVISRYRAACSPDLVSLLSYGPTLLEPIGFAMDRRMLLGLKELAEGSARAAS